MARYILFADTNVFLDALLQRHAEKACKSILFFAEKASIKLYTSSSCLLTIVYFLQKSGMPQEDVRASVANLLELFSLQPAKELDFIAAMNSSFSDLEDAVEYQTALRIKGIDYFVTSNIKDFRGAKGLPVITPGNFINLIDDDQF